VALNPESTALLYQVVHVAKATVPFDIAVHARPDGGLGSDDVSNALRADAIWDKALLQLVQLTVGPGELFVDAGAHIGLHVLAAAAAGAEVVAFEALPANQALLQASLDEGLLSLCLPILYYLWNTYSYNTCQWRMTVRPRISTQASLCLNGFGDRVKVYPIGLAADGPTPCRLLLPWREGEACAAGGCAADGLPDCAVGGCDGSAVRPGFRCADFVADALFRYVDRPIAMLRLAGGFDGSEQQVRRQPSLPCSSRARQTPRPAGSLRRTAGLSQARPAGPNCVRVLGLGTLLAAASCRVWLPAPAAGWPGGRASGAAAAAARLGRCGVQLWRFRCFGSSVSSVRLFVCVQSGKHWLAASARPCS
jgi:hypothetical protein